ncbi:MAG: pyridoxal-phosphate dependent enzyme [Planctomycetes bacterium]|nr:pyridoxal-phosphate dependent enzyme [Planctomycetota bacterium]
MTKAAAQLEAGPIAIDAARAGGVLGAVGNTPLFELKRIGAEVAPVRIFAKAEWFNPGGSVKDRPALNMLLDGERRGALNKNKTILDATSGNTGIAYAMFGAAMGYRVKLCLPSIAGKLHKRILRAYGAEIVETPGAEASDGAIREAIRLYESDPDAYFYPDQYNNDANWLAHYHGTGVEIWNQTRGEVTHFVAGLGTSGTFTGITRRLKDYSPSIKCISVQPDTPLHALEGWKHMPTSIKPGFYDPSLADENREVRTEDAQVMIRRLAAEEGLLVSASAAAAVHSALQVAKEIERGTVVTVMADNASKYLDHLNI